MRVLNQGAKIGSQPGGPLARALQHLSSLNGRTGVFGHMHSRYCSKGLKIGVPFWDPILRVLNQGDEITLFWGPIWGTPGNPYLEHLWELNGVLKGFGHMGLQYWLKRPQNRGPK